MTPNHLSRIAGLIGRPHRYERPCDPRALDCAQACAEALRRMGMVDAASALPTVDAPDVRAAITEGRSRGWTRVDDAVNAGDLLLGQNRDGSLCVWLLLEAGGLLITATRTHGVHLVARDRAVGVVSAWRFAP